MLRNFFYLSFIASLSLPALAFDYFPEDFDINFHASDVNKMDVTGRSTVVLKMLACDKFSKYAQVGKTAIDREKAQKKSRAVRKRKSSIEKVARNLIRTYTTEVQKEYEVLLNEGEFHAQLLIPEFETPRTLEEKDKLERLEYEQTMYLAKCTDIGSGWIGEGNYLPLIGPKNSNQIGISTPVVEKVKILCKIKFSDGGEYSQFYTLNSDFEWNANREVWVWWDKKIDSELTKSGKYYSLTKEMGLQTGVCAMP